jgi:hypothetical protein
LIDAPAQAGVRCGHGYRLAAGMTGRKHHYFFFVSSLSSLRALSIAGLGAKSSSSKSWRSSISHSAFSPCGAGARLAHSIASAFDLTWISQ